MRRRGRRNLPDSGLVFGLLAVLTVLGLVGLLVGLLVGVRSGGVLVVCVLVVLTLDVLGCLLVDVLGLLLCGVLDVVRVCVDSALARRHEPQAPARDHTAPPQAPRSLRWVGGLLPGGEGAAWLAEVGSCLAEAQDKNERRGYVRSYRRNVPRLVWTSWTEHLSKSGSRELS
ncbi:MAG: hypothetical protein ACRDQ4_04860 [Pseudonocardiaceae bacterium]